MAAPLGIVLSFMGAMIGHRLQVERWSRRQVHALLLLALLAMPLLMGADGVSGSEPALFAVTATIDIDPPPGRVRRHRIPFPPVPRPDDSLFRAGVPYPVRAVIEGRGPGAVRHCVFSTGEFLEPIETWDEPRLLKFSVLSTPAPMVEWSP